jgi:hypothetical protein
MHMTNSASFREFFFLCFRPYQVSIDRGSFGTLVLTPTVAMLTPAAAIIIIIIIILDINHITLLINQHYPLLKSLCSPSPQDSVDGGSI